MANFRAIHRVGSSLVRYLNSAFALAAPVTPPVQFQLVSSGELNEPGDRSNVVTLYLYRVTNDPFTRNLPAVNAASDDEVPLSLSLHYMLTVWSSSAQQEHLILGWVMRELYTHQALTPSDLLPDADWDPGEIIQLVPSEIATEDMMRIWDALEPGYRLSVSYTARVVRIDADAPADALPAVARRLTANANAERPA